jgi:hypothetical protein
MKLILSLALATVSAFTLVSADFLISQSDWTLTFCPSEDCQPEEGAQVLACPSNNASCKCYVDGNGSAGMDVGGDDITSDLSFMKMPKGICGSGALDFYKNPDGHWDMYIAGGDSSIKGRCTPRSGGFPCNRVIFSFDINYRLYCATSFCGT